MKPHVHAEWIKAKADGHTIQERGRYSEWEDMPESNFKFNEHYYYRIKPTEPEKVYPVTNMTREEIARVYHDHVGTVPASWIATANAAIRRAIDDGQVVIADFENTWKAKAYDEWMEKTKWVQSNSSHFNFNATGMHRADVMKREIDSLRVSLDDMDKALSSEKAQHATTAAMLRHSYRMLEGTGWEKIGCNWTFKPNQGVK